MYITTVSTHPYSNVEFHSVTADEQVLWGSPPIWSYFLSGFGQHLNRFRAEFWHIWEHAQGRACQVHVVYTLQAVTGYYRKWMAYIGTEFLEFSSVALLVVTITEQSSMLPCILTYLSLIKCWVNIQGGMQIRRNLHFI